MVEYGRRQNPPLGVAGVPLDARALVRHQDQIEGASVLVLDVGDNPDGALAVSKAVRKQRSELPTLSILCCERPTLPWHLRHLVDLGVTSFVDARVEPTELGAEVVRLAAGRKELHFQLHQRHVSVAAALFTDTTGGRHVPIGADQAALVELVALGLSNTEIAERLNLAPSTVHHHVADLCKLLGLPNRTALAAWAGANRYFDPRKVENPRGDEDD